MPAFTVRRLCAAFEVFRPHLRRAAYVKFVLLACAWAVIPGRHTVAAGLVALGFGDVGNWSAYYRLFSHGRWSPDVLGRALLTAWVARLGDAVLTFVVDDTVLPHPGPVIWGAGSHRDAARSSRTRRAFTRGHRWVVLALVVRLPFARRPWAIPVLFRLYRTRAVCAASGAPVVTTTALARAMIERVATWLPGRRLRVVGDAAFTCRTVMRDLPAGVAFVGALRGDAVLTAVPTPTRGARGRPRRKGARLPTPAALVADARRPWQRVAVTLYGRARRPAYKVLNGQWYKVCGAAEVRVVVVRALCARTPWRAFISTDPAIDVAALLETFAARWSIEALIRDLKQVFGWSQPQVRVEAAVARLAPFLGLVYGALVLAAVDLGLTVSTAGVPARRWYPRKAVLTFEDLVRAVRRIDARRAISNEASVLHDVPEMPSPLHAARPPTIPMAA